MWSQVEKVGAEKHPNRVDKKILYGTAGLRTKADVLDHVMYRMGVLAVLRSKLKGATIGVMVTASHNPEGDNGVKLVDPMGEMLQQSWEPMATELANAEDSRLGAVLQKIVDQEEISAGEKASVYVGRDTRLSSPSLSRAVLDGVEAAGGVARDFGVVTTPQLHYNVVCRNTGGEYGEEGEEGYYRKLAGAFSQLREGAPPSPGNYRPALSFDGANGVGAPKMRRLLAHLGDCLRVDIFNSGEDDGQVLNLGCGADFVKVQQAAPAGMEKVGPGERCVSVDGDADRVIFFFSDEAGRFHMLDGDKIATLVAGYLKELLTEAKLDLKLGLVQTAYANGSSTKYIKDQLSVPVACVPTGVKHLHHAALSFDVGVYFEANGHGTVVFSQEAQGKIVAAAKDGNSSARRLAGVVGVINQAVGDALSDLLLVETILHARGWSAQDWSKAYTDLPNRLLKVRVSDRTVIKTADAERKAVSPQGMQAEIDKIVSKYDDGRSFVRPSGTEDVVRVYAEAATQSSADALAVEVGEMVHKMAGGVGEPPKF